MKKLSCIGLLLIAAFQVAAQQLISSENTDGAFPIHADRLPSIYTDTLDDWLVNKSAALLQKDIEMVTGRKPEIVHQLTNTGNTIIIGTVSGSAAIRQLAEKKEINISAVSGKWEAFQLQTINKNNRQMLIICGADKRGAAYGVFELSTQLGVSPWYWWADVPARKTSASYFKPGIYTYKSPSVKYRGIFLNDEAPALSGWAREKFGGFNHLMYEKVFELLLRLKANYLWPAMWGNAFNDDDTLNPVLAHQWGIVMGTSHHEPMHRAQAEWKRYGKGAWDYTKNEDGLKQFWTNGIRNMRNHESIVTIGMRGDGDEPMTTGTATSLLEKIVADQRQILEQVTGKPASATPQLWALYKEVQDYYDAGMRVPDDVTLLLCDDNWGNIRRLPRPEDKPRKGGYGIYYHFDYVGGPRNYKWINTNNISRVWEQMHLAWQYGARNIWIVNVGDLKPMELPVSFFLGYAYNTGNYNESNVTTFFNEWAAQQFGQQYADAIGNVLRKYSHLASARKPELLDARTYLLDNHQFDSVLHHWILLKQQALETGKQIPDTYKDAYFQLVLHPVLALENLHQLYYAVAMNKHLAGQGDAHANQWADKARMFYEADSLLSVQYNREIAGGKWNHMMDQTHIGYKSWQEPRKNVMPAITYIEPGIPAIAARGSAIKESRVPAGKNGRLIKASAYSKMINSKGIQWKVIPDIGKNGDGVTSFPVTASAPLSQASPHLEYDIYADAGDSIRLSLSFSPTLNFLHLPEGLRFAVSIDDETPQLLSLNKEDNTGVWNTWVANNNIVKTSAHKISASGKHTIRYWMVDPGVILQHIEIK